MSGAPTQIRKLAARLKLRSPLTVVAVLDNILMELALAEYHKDWARFRNGRVALMTLKDEISRVGFHEGIQEKALKKINQLLRERIFVGPTDSEEKRDRRRGLFSKRSQEEALRAGRQDVHGRSMVRRGAEKMAANSRRRKRR